MVAAAIVGAGAIGAIGSTVAAGQQSSADTNAAATQAGMFNTITNNEQPFMQAGQQASSTLSQLMGTSGVNGAPVSGTGLNDGYLNSTFNPTQQQLNDYPGYQFALQQGGQALTNSQTPSAGALSGSTLKSLMGFNQGMANTNYGNYFNQFQTQQNNIFNRLSGIAGIGQNAAGNLGNNGAQLGTGEAQAGAAAGAATAGGTVGASNAIGNSALLSNFMSNNSGGGYNQFAGGQYTANPGGGGEGLPVDSSNPTIAGG